MSIKIALKKADSLINSMTEKDKEATMNHIRDIATAIEDTIHNQEIWTKDNLSKFNGLMKYILLTIEYNDISFGINIIRKDLIPLLNQLLLDERLYRQWDIKLTDETTNAIKTQYTRYMYPNRWRGIIPERILQSRLETNVGTALGNLNYVEHMTFQKFLPTGNLKVLIAGCGTGEDAISMALRHTDTQFTFVDISSASLQLTKSYVTELGMENVEILQEDIMTMDLKKRFDIIISTGVIHHLSNPSQGVANLKRHLEDWGALSVMVYGEYGRYEIGLFQEAMKIILDSKMDFEEGIDIVKTILNEVNNSNRLANIAWKQDTLKGEQHIVDLLLNVNEYRYNIQTLNSMVNDGGMKIVAFPNSSTLSPENYVKDVKLKQKFKKLNNIERCRLAELINGRLSKLQFYAVKEENNYKKLSVEDKDSNQYIVHKSPFLIEQSITHNGVANHMLNINHVSLYESNITDYKPINCDKHIMRFFNLCNGINSLGKILSKLSKEVDINKIKKFIKEAEDRRMVFFHLS